MQHHRATEAITNGGYASRVHGGVILKVPEGGTQTGVRLTHIAQHAVHEPAGIVGIVRHLAAAVHVDGQRRVPQLRQHVRPPANMVGQPPPFVDNQNTRAARGAMIIKSEVAFQFSTIGVQPDRFCVQI